MHEVVPSAPPADEKTPKSPWRRRSLIHVPKFVHKLLRRRSRIQSATFGQGSFTEEVGFDELQDKAPKRTDPIEVRYGEPRQQSCPPSAARGAHQNNLRRSDSAISSMPPCFASRISPLGGQAALVEFAFQAAMASAEANVSWEPRCIPQGANRTRSAQRPSNPEAGKRFTAPHSPTRTGNAFDARTSLHQPQRRESREHDHKASEPWERQKEEYGDQRPMRGQFRSTPSAASPMTSTTYEVDAGRPAPSADLRQQRNRKAICSVFGDCGVTVITASDITSCDFEVEVPKTSTGILVSTELPVRPVVHKLIRNVIASKLPLPVMVLLLRSSADSMCHSYGPVAKEISFLLQLGVDEVVQEPVGSECFQDFVEAGYMNALVRKQLSLESEQLAVQARGHAGRVTG